jgi:hypothetical protein
MTIPRGLKNNNPGNIRHDGTKWQGEVSPATDKSFKQFTSIVSGYRALILLLQNYRKLHNRQTIADFITRWAPPVENDTKAYIERVCKDMKVNADEVPDVSDKQTMCTFAAAISKVENGVPAVMADVVAGWELLNKQ